MILCDNRRFIRLCGDLFPADQIAGRIILILFLLADQILLTGQAVQRVILKAVGFLFFIDQRFQPSEPIITEPETVSRRIGTLSDLSEDITGDGDFFTAAVGKAGDTPGIVIGIAVIPAVR